MGIARPFSGVYYGSVLAWALGLLTVPATGRP